MNILFLHGCCQNNEIFTSLMKVYLKFMLRKNENINSYFIEGQYDHSRAGKTWFKTELNLDMIGTDNIPEDEINDTLNNIETFIKTNSINILIGFSQGGNVIDTYLRLKNADNHIKSALILNGYSFPRYHNIKPIVNKLIFIYSTCDDIVNHELLYDNYDNIICIHHNKGHKINLNKSFIQIVINELIC